MLVGIIVDPQSLNSLFFLLVSPRFVKAADHDPLLHMQALCHGTTKKLSVCRSGEQRVAELSFFVRVPRWQSNSHAIIVIDPPPAEAGREILPKRCGAWLRDQTSLRS